MAERSVEEIAEEVMRGLSYDVDHAALPKGQSYRDAAVSRIAAALRAEREKVPPEDWTKNYHMAAEIIKRLVWVPSLMAWTLSCRDVAAISTSVIIGPGVIRFIDLKAAAKEVQGE